MKNTKIADLTRREVQILKLIGEGMSSNEIAGAMFLSPKTVCTHRKNILRKTGAKNIISVVILAIQQHVITMDNLAA